MGESIIHAIALILALAIILSALYKGCELERNHEYRLKLLNTATGRIENGKTN